MKRTAKIAVIIVIIGLIALMFFLKNSQGKDEAAPAKDIDVTAAAEGATTTEEKEARMPMTQEQFDMDKWLEPGLPLLVDFGSKSCGPCQKMKPDLIEFYEEMEGKMTVVYLDVWEDPSRTGGLPANVVPTQFFFNPDGTPYMPSKEIMTEYYGFQQYTLKGSSEVVLTSHQGILWIDGLRAIAAEMGVGI